MLMFEEKRECEASELLRFIGIDFVVALIEDFKA